MADLVRQTLVGPGTVTINGGLFFKLIQSGAPVDITFEHGGTTKKATQVEAGYQYGPLPELKRFDRVKISASTGQTIVALVGEEYEDYDRIIGLFSISKPAGLAELADVTIATASATLVRAANSSRRKIHITNLDQANFIRVGSATVAAGRGLVLAAGMTVTLETTAAVYAIADTSAVDVAVLEETD